MDGNRDDFLRVMQQEAGRDIDPMELLYPDELPIFDKYDEFLPAELVRKGFAYGVLDISGAQERILGWR
jgi:ATP-dependent Lhr-like helicase